MGRLTTREFWRHPPAWLYGVLVVVATGGTYLLWQLEGWSGPLREAGYVGVWATSIGLVSVLADRYGTEDPDGSWWSTRLRSWGMGLILAVVVALGAPNRVAGFLVVVAGSLVGTELGAAARRGRAAAVRYDERVREAQER
jgi:hypothetical protein